MAVKIPSTIWRVDAARAQIKVQERTEAKAERKVLKVQMFVKFVNPTQSNNLFGGNVEVIVGKGNHQG